MSVWERFLEIARPEEAPAVWNRLVHLMGEIEDEKGLLEAWAGLAKALPDGPDKANAYKRLGGLYLASGDKVRAEGAYLEAARLEETDGQLFLSLARLASVRGDREAYRGNLERALELGPSPELAMELARAYEQDGLKDRAAASLLELARGAGGEADSVREEAESRLLALLRPQTGFSEEFEKALYELSDNEVEFYNLGVARFKAGDWERAEKAFQRALELDGDESLALDVRGYLLAIYKRTGRADDMVTQAMQLYRSDPSRREYRELVLDRFVSAKDWPALIGAAGEWTRWNPGDPENWRLLALGQRSAGQALEAARSLARAAEAEKTSAASWLAAAEALEAAGEGQAAKSAYERVAELAPDNEKAASALLRMALEGVAKNRR
jgi:tetratricopeptide (TPR) repeat protein